MAVFFQGISQCSEREDTEYVSLFSVSQPSEEHRTAPEFFGVAQPTEQSSAAPTLLQLNVGFDNRSYILYSPCTFNIYPPPSLNNPGLLGSEELILAPYVFNVGLLSQGTPPPVNLANEGLVGAAMMALGVSALNVGILGHLKDREVVSYPITFNVVNEPVVVTYPVTFNVANVSIVQYPVTFNITQPVVVVQYPVSFAVTAVLPVWWNIIYQGIWKYPVTFDLLEKFSPISLDTSWALLPGGTSDSRRHRLIVRVYQNDEFIGSAGYVVMGQAAKKLKAHIVVERYFFGAQRLEVWDNGVLAVSQENDYTRHLEFTLWP